jgi:hypothetical protein
VANSRKAGIQVNNSNRAGIQIEASQDGTVSVVVGQGVTAVAAAVERENRCSQATKIVISVQEDSRELLYLEVQSGKPKAAAVVNRG